MDDYPHSILTVDVALMTLKDERLHIALLRRLTEPFEGALALPGGYVRPEQDEDLTATATRIMKEKCGLQPQFVEQLFSFSGRHRDPRGWSVSVTYLGLAPLTALEAGCDSVELKPVDAAPRLPFDHDEILSRAVQRIRDKATYSSLPLFLLGPQFTLSELQSVYEAVMGQRLDRASFRRKILSLGLIEPSGDLERGAAHRPAKTYQAVQSQLTAFSRAFNNRE